MATRAFNQSFINWKITVTLKAYLWFVAKKCVTIIRYSVAVKLWTLEFISVVRFVKFREFEEILHEKRHGKLERAIFFCFNRKNMRTKIICEVASLN